MSVLRVHMPGAGGIEELNVSKASTHIRRYSMTQTRGVQSPTQNQVRAWEAELKGLWSKLHSARPLEKIGYYEEIKSIEAKLAGARERSARTDVMKEQLLKSRNKSKMP